MLLALNKPYGFLSQFTPEPGSKWRTLSELGLPSGVYPIGRLDADSEGLLLLSDETALVDQLLNPRNAHAREYWAQVERHPSEQSLTRLSRGIMLNQSRTLPCKLRLLEPAPQIAPRDPPIRFRKNVPDCWLSLELTEGKNRQVRRMTAAIGHPTLRLIRTRIGMLEISTLKLLPGSWKQLTPTERALIMFE